MNKDTQERKEDLVSEALQYYIRTRHLLNQPIEELKWLYKNASKKEEERTKKDIVEHEAKLRTYSIDELKKYAAQISRNLALTEDQQKWQLILNHKIFESKIQYWAKMTTWTLEQGMALVLDKDPELVYSRLLKEIEGHEKSCFVEYYTACLGLAQNAQEAGILHDTNTPVDFLKWCEGKDIEISAELKQSCDIYSSSKKSYKEPIKGNDKSSQTLQLKTARKIIAVIALKKFKSLPNKLNNAATYIINIRHAVIYIRHLF